MSEIIEYITQIDSEHTKEIEKIKKELTQYPQGCLVKRDRHGYACYFHVENGREKTITHKEVLIRSLAKKRYLQERYRKLAVNLKATRRFLQTYQSLSPGDLIHSLSSTYRELPLRCFFDEEGFNKDYETTTYKEEERIYATNNGVLVRTKSELRIANALEAKGVLYHYEEVVNLNGKKYIPDFTIFKKSTGEIIRWEHFGCTDDSGYLQSMNKKLAVYEANGLIPFVNLICTTEATIKDSRTINRIIDIYLL